MNVIEWLKSNAPGFAALKEDEISAPMHFALLWSYFESQALNTNASANAIGTWVQALSAAGKLDSGELAQRLDYFKRRYFHNGELTHHFESLNLRQNDHPTLVERVIRGNGNDDTEEAIALFIIIYRLRNNLLHGDKWAYYLHDQRENFEVANHSIVAVMEMSLR